MYCSVPPSQLDIFSDQGILASNSVVGPYKEGSSVNITCMSSGGKCLLLSSNDTFLHTITPASPVRFLYCFYGQIYIILLYNWCEPCLILYTEIFLMLRSNLNIIRVKHNIKIEIQMKETLISRIRQRVPREYFCCGSSAGGW